MPYNLPDTTEPEGMDGDRLGVEIAREIELTLRRSIRFRAGYLFGSYISILMWQAIGRAIVRHIQRNMVVTTRVEKYYIQSGPLLIPPGEVDGEFQSETVE